MTSNMNGELYWTFDTYEKVQFCNSQNAHRIKALQLLIDVRLKTSC
jgi:hypothetical protein